MKIAIYTIAKNESHNVEAFMKAANGAPVFVLDTGSTDNTVELLKEHGAHVTQQEITPWRFDTARNKALALVPDNVDVCVSLDMDEIIEDGWQDKLKSEWSGNFGDYRYIAEWKDKEKTIPLVITPRTRIHTRHGFEWHRQIHEVLRALPETTIQKCDTSVLVKHYQDDKQRNYSDALDRLIEQNPNDVDAWVQRAGEMYQKQKWKEAIKDFKQYLRLMDEDNSPSGCNRKSHAWLAIATCYHFLNDNSAAYRSFIHAVASDPSCREAWTHLAHITSQLGNVPLTYGAAMTAHSFKNPPSYAAIDATCWTDYPKQLADSMFAKLVEGT
jgi:glycosyltransferase involved in cell wall biosynthesis